MGLFCSSRGIWLSVSFFRLLLFNKSNIIPAEVRSSRIDRETEHHFVVAVFFFCSNEFIVLNTAVIAFDLLCAIKRSQCCAARPCFLKNPFLSFVSPSAFLFPGIAVHLIQLVLTCAALHRGQPVVALVRTLHLQMAITLKRRIAAAAPTAVCRREQLEACTLISTGCMFFPMTAQQVTAFPMNAQNLESAASQRFF